MSIDTRPTVQRRRLRAELRRLRDEAGYTRDQVANAMDWSLSKLIRIETGSVGVSTTDLRALLSFYGASDPAWIDTLVGMARTSRQRMWWSELKDRTSPTLLTYIAFEAEAERITHYCTSFLPGLVQTEAYMRAAIAAAGLVELPPAELDERVRVRLRRQQADRERTDPADLIVVLDEAVLRRVVGGRQVMCEQLDHVATLAEQGRVTVSVLPFSQGAYPGMGRSFTLLEFDDPADDVVYLDGGAQDVFLQQAPSDIAQHRSALEGLRTLALGHTGSVQLVRQIAGSLR